MAKYRYNGIELPQLPEWDKATYPYAYIIEGAWVDGRYSNGYVFVAYKAEANMSKTNEGTLTFGYPSGSAYILYYLNADATGWETTGFSNATMYLVAVPIWANTDVYFNEDDGGALYLPASAPIPASVLTARDLYRKINGKPTKLTLYKKLGGKLIPLGEHTKEVKHD